MKTCYFKMSDNYEIEQAELKEKVKKHKGSIDHAKSKMEDISKFISLVDKHSDFEELKAIRKKQTIRLMTIWAIALCGVYALLCGIVQTAFFPLSDKIWLFWFSLPIVPPVVFAVRFYKEIGAKLFMFFIDLPFIAGIVYMLTVFYANPAWIVFLSIPVYYAIAVAVFIILTKRQKNK